MTSSRNDDPVAGLPSDKPGDARAQFAQQAQALLDGGASVEELRELLPPELLQHILHQGAVRNFTGFYALGQAVCAQPNTQYGGVGDFEARAALVRLWAQDILRICAELRHPARNDSDQHTADRVDSLEVHWQLLKGAMAWIVAAGDECTLMNVLCRDPKVVSTLVLALDTGWQRLLASDAIPRHNWNGSQLDTTPTPDLMTQFITKAGEMRERLASMRHHP
jgi:hypothetical protein